MAESSVQPKKVSLTGMFEYAAEKLEKVSSDSSKKRLPSLANKDDRLRLCFLAALPFLLPVRVPLSIVMKSELSEREKTSPASRLLRSITTGSVRRS